MVTTIFAALLFFSSGVTAQVAPVNPPAGGFAIDGGLKANTPVSPAPFAANQGDWVAGTGGGGGFVLSNTGVAADNKTTGLKKDPYNSGADDIFTGGSKFNDVISALQWTSSSAPDKNDINNGLYHVTKDPSTNNQWVMIAGDRLSTNGTSYIDFEFLQGTLTKNPNGTFTGSGPAGGRTIGDLVISMEYTNGGAIANVFFYQWTAKTGGGFEFVQFTPAAADAFARTNAANEDVPFGAFSGIVYQPFAFVEAAINITKVLQATSDPCAGLSVKTLWIKTKASASTTAALKDFVDPIPVSFDFGSASISYVTPLCQASGTANVTLTGITGGSFSASPAGLSINSSTGAIDIGASTPGTYTVTYSFTTNGCNKTATAPVVIKPTPTVAVNSPVKCASDPSVTITATPTPAPSVTNVYSYAWTVPPGASAPGNVASFSATVGGPYSVTATLSGCSATGSGTLTVNPNPTITSPAVGNVCAGASSAAVSYSGVSGSPDKYRIDWNAAANTAGLSDIALSNLPASPFNISTPGTLVPGTYNGTIYVKNSTTGCESGGGAVSLTVNGNPTANAGTAPAAQCADGANGNTFGLSGSGTNGSPSWAVQNNPNGLTVQITGGSTFSPSVKVSGGSGSVTLRLTVTSSATPSCGSQTSDVTVTVNPNATANAGTAPTAQCYDAANGNTFNLSGSGSNGTPSWSVQSRSPNTLNAVITSGSTYTPSVTVTGGSGTVTLRLTVNSNTSPDCGNPTSDVTVTVNPLPTVNAGTDPAAQCYVASGNVFTLSGTGTNGNPSWAVAPGGNPGGLTVQITNGNTLTPSVKISGNASGGTVTLRLTTVSNQTPSCGSATDDIDLRVSTQVAGPDATMLPVNCTDQTFKVQVNNPVNGTKYTATQPLNNNPYFAEIAYNGSGTVIFTGLKFGDGYSVIASKDGCVSAPNDCNGQESARTTTTTTRTNTTVANDAKVSSNTAVSESGQLKVLAYPNPFGDRLNFLITSPVPGRGSLEVYNYLGQKVKTVFQGNLTKGTQNYSLRLPLRQQANLVYVLRVGDKRLSGKILQLNQ